MNYSAIIAANRHYKKYHGGGWGGAPTPLLLAMLLIVPVFLLLLCIVGFHEGSKMQEMPCYIVSCEECITSGTGKRRTHYREVTLSNGEEVSVSHRQSACEKFTEGNEVILHYTPEDKKGILSPYDYITIP